jgi:NAD(P)-dependent dehydrogenase (short-subunit alcohol dehydrogenase family)
MVVRHAYLAVRHLAPLLVARGGGTMVFVASISGVSSAPFHGAYGSAKAGLISLVKTAAMELKPAEIRVNSVTPGNTATPRIAVNAGRPAEELANGSLSAHGSVADIASAILFFCSDLSRHITGQNLAVDGGDLAKFPHDLGEAPPLPSGRVYGEPQL